MGDVAVSATTIDLSTSAGRTVLTSAALMETSVQIRSTSSSVNVPANTASRRNTACSVGSSRSCDHSTAASSVWWRGSVRRPAVSSVKRSSRPVATSASAMVRTLAAASSMASGTPSRRRQISTTDGTAAGVRRNPGWAEIARSTNSPTLADRIERIGSVSLASGTGSGCTRCTCSPSTASGSRLVARIRTPGHMRRTVSVTSPIGASRCSQLSNTTSR